MGTSQRLTRTLPLAAALLLLLAPPLVRAQSSEAQTQKSQSKEARSKENQSKETTPKVFCDSARAVSLVEMQLSEAKMFADASRRLSVMTRAADLLWPYERDSAREIFQQAYDLAVKDFREHENDPEPKDSMAPPRADQRYIVMSAIGRRDAAWARRLAEAVAEEKRREAEQGTSAAKATDSGGWKPGLAENTLGLADSLLKTDREASLALVRSTFRQPASFLLVQYFYVLARADRAAADALYAEAVNAYRDGTASDLAYLAVYAFGLDREPGSVPLAYGYSPPDGFAPDPRLCDLFLEALFRQVETKFRTPEVAQTEDSRATTEQGQLLMMLVMLEPVVARTRPAVLERFVALRGMATAAATAQSRGRAESFERFRREHESESDTAFDRTVEQIERERDPAKRDYYVMNLVMSAHNAEDLARAETFLDKVSDASLREKLASYLYFVWTQQALKDGQLDDATRLSKKVSELDYRALLSFEIAGAALKKLNDRARAVELLDAVASDAEKAPDTPAKARVLLGVAHLYAGFDSTRAAQVLRAAVKVVNLLPDPDFSSEIIGRELGNSAFTMYAVYSVPGMRLENAFRELGALDFESALSAASDLSDKYQRALAVLGLASKCLEDSAATPKKKR
jgi:rhodanese-related sulfurtransferase